MRITAGTSATPSFHCSVFVSRTRSRSWVSNASSGSRACAGRSAPYPVWRITSTRRSGRMAPGSNATVASPVIRLTEAELTPGVRSSERCTRPLQAAQVMPVTGIVQTALAADIVQGRRVAGVANRPGELGGHDPGFVEADVSSANQYRLDLYVGKGGQSVLHGADAVVATHPFDLDNCAGHEQILHRGRGYVNVAAERRLRRRGFPLTEGCKTPRGSRAATKALGLDSVESRQSHVHQ